MKRPLIIVLDIVVLTLLGLVGYELVKPDTTTTASTVQTAPVVQTAPTPQPPTRAELLALVNDERLKVGAKPLKLSSQLDWSAQQKANDMEKYHYFGHFRDGVFIGQEFIDKSGIQCPYDSENLGWTTDGSLETAPDAIKWWMGSTPHREAMLNPKYTLTGFGIVHNAVVEHFCQP